MQLEDSRKDAWKAWGSPNHDPHAQGKSPWGIVRTIVNEEDGFRTEAQARGKEALLGMLGHTRCFDACQ